MGTGEACWDHPGEEDWLDISSQWVAAQIASLLETRIPFCIFLKQMHICPSARDHRHFPLLAVSLEVFFSLKPMSASW